MSSSKYTVPGMSAEDATKVVQILQDRLTATLDLQLTLKHVHWNVVGPSFIAVHEMLDPQVEEVRLMSDALAERIATLGHEPLGTPGAITAQRSWDDYSINRADTQQHLAALDVVYDGLNADHRRFVGELDDLDLVSQGLLIDQLEKLEMYQWFVRAHLEDRSGSVASAGARTEEEAAEQVAGRS